MDSKDWVKVYKVEEFNNKDYPRKTCLLWTRYWGDKLWLRVGEIVRIEVMPIIHQTDSGVGGPELGPVFFDQKDQGYVPFFYFDQDYDEEVEFLKDVLCPWVLR